MVVIGLDSGRETHCFHAINRGCKTKLGEGVIANKTSVFAEWAAKMEGYGEPIRLAVEVGNGISTPIEQFAESRRWEVVHVSANAVKSYRENVLGQHNKTDRIDAEAVALLASESRGPGRTKSQCRRELRRVVRDRCHLVKEKTRVKNRIRQLLAEVCPEFDTQVIPELEAQPILWLLSHHPDPRQWAQLGEKGVKALAIAAKVPSRITTIRSLVRVAENYQMTLGAVEGKLLMAEIRMVARRLQHLLDDVQEADSLIAALAETDQDVQLLDTIPGVGLVLASEVAAEIQDISNFESEAKLASYSGAALKRHQTGKSANFNRPQLRANHRLKRSLLQLALCASQWEPRSKAYHHKKVNEGKTPLQARRSLARQLVRLIYAMLKHRKAYEATS